MRELVCLQVMFLCVNEQLPLNCLVLILCLQDKLKSFITRNYLHKIHSTFPTNEWPFPRMFDFMVFQLAGIHEHFSTCFACHVLHVFMNRLERKR